MNARNPLSEVKQLGIKGVILYFEYKDCRQVPITFLVYSIVCMCGVTIYKKYNTILCVFCDGCIVTV